MHMICETMLRRSEECIASTCEDSEEQQSDFERTEDSDSQGRWDTNFGEMWTSLLSEKNRSWNMDLRHYKPSLRVSGTGPKGALSKGNAGRQIAFHSLCQNEMKQMRSSSRYMLKTVISLIIVAKEVKGDRKVEILNGKETKDREKRCGTTVHTQTTGKKLSEIQR